MHGIRPGDRVFGINGRLRQEGLLSCWGGHLHHHVTDAASLIKLPDGVSTREAAGLVLAQVGYNGASRPRVTPAMSRLSLATASWASMPGRSCAIEARTSSCQAITRNGWRTAAGVAADEVVNSHEQDLKAYVFSRYPRVCPSAWKRPVRVS